MSAFIKLVGVCLALVANLAVADTLLDSVERRDLAALRALLDAGADPQGDPAGAPLYFAAFQGFDEAVALLLAHGADPNAMTGNGAPLHGAARKTRLGAARVLLAAGADPDLPEPDEEQTPLHMAAFAGRVEMIALLLDAGADINARTARGEPAIHLAALRKRKRAIAFLKERGFAPEPVDPVTPLLAAADAQEGRVLAEECLGCHTFDRGKHGPQAPTLWGVVGRQPGTAPGYDYSLALMRHRGVWDFEALNRYLADVTGTVPGVKMYAGGQSDPLDRAHIILFLRSLSVAPVPLP